MRLLIAIVLFSQLFAAETPLTATIQVWERSESQYAWAVNTVFTQDDMQLFKNWASGAFQMMGMSEEAASHFSPYQKFQITLTPVEDIGLTDLTALTAVIQVFQRLETQYSWTVDAVFVRDGSLEAMRLFKSWPSGKFQMAGMNEEAAGHFSPGRKFLVTIAPVVDVQNN